MVFGPVPSRRLGSSLGISNIPPNVCSYSCVYCQAGRTCQIQTKRRAFYDPADIRDAVSEKLTKADALGTIIDYVTFVPDGEPTLDSLLGKTIVLLKPLGIKIAVITNGSLIWEEEVRADLLRADWVSLKVDATVAETWRRINRPHGALKLDAILNGMLEFAQRYQGTLVTETMLVKDLNDSIPQIEKMLQFLTRLKPATAYITLPTRRPAEAWVQPPGEEAVQRAYRMFRDHLENVA